MLIFLKLVALLIVTWIIWVIKVKRKYKGFPPGPPHLPLVGSLFSLPVTKFGSKAFLQLSKKYGDVVHVKIGFMDAITFNSYEAVKEILCHEKASGRARDIIPLLRERQRGKNIGIVFASGEPWKIQRNFTIRTLRNFGFGKASSMDVVINQELDKLLHQINSQMGIDPQEGIQAEEMFDQTMIHIVWRLVTGIEYKFGDPKIQRFLEVTKAAMKSTNFAFDLSTAFPFLWDWFPNWFGKNKQMRVLHDVIRCAQKTIDEHVELEVYKKDPQCYIDVYLAKIEETRNDPTSEFNDEQLLYCILDLFAAGGETTGSTLSFSLLYMILYPDIQEKVWKEIEQEIGKQCMMITTDMRIRLPYSHSTLLECFRWSSVVPIIPARMATEDFYFRGYLIKKGTPILANMEAAHFSEKQWGDPDNFRPERFLKEDGSVDINIAKNLLSFGEGGKRNCIGQNLAESSSFIFFTSILRSFKLVKVEGQSDPSPVPVPGMTYSPQPFQLRFIHRK